MKNYFCGVSAAVLGAAAFLCTSAETPANAEVYEYTQDDGTKAYTDDLAKVPEKYRAAAVEKELPPSAAVRAEDGLLVELKARLSDLRVLAAIAGVAVALAAILVVIRVRRRRALRRMQHRNEQFERIRKV